MSDALTNQKVLVTGGSGFIGSHLCRRLREMKVEVHAVSRAPCRSDKAGCQWWAADLADFGATQRLLRKTKPHTIFHLASCVTGVRSLEAIVPTFLSNAATTVNLLAAATEVGCRRIVLAGSSEEPVTDLPDTVPCSPYAAAKWVGSMYGRLLHDLYGAPVVNARIFMAYGPAQPDERKLVPYVTLCLLEGKTPQLASGQRRVDWIYIDDVVEGLLAAASAPDVEGCTFDFGCGLLVTVRDVVDRLVGLIAPHVTPGFGAIEDRPREPERVADVRPAQDRLAWTPVTSLDVGLARTVDWYRLRRCQQATLLK